MEELQSSLLVAIDHYENGQIKDAYNSFLLLAQTAIKPLFDVKFVHCSIVSKPHHSDALLSLLHSSVDYIEKIMDSHSMETKIIPPPLPPKPTLVGKPVLPPKPVKSNLRSQPPKLTLAPTLTSSPTSLLPLDRLTPSTTVPDGEVDPSELVPAQTNNNDTLTPTGHSSISDHIPNIPIPPLLKTHRVLQTKLDALESALKDFRQRKNQLEPHQEALKQELDEAIEKYTPYVAEAKWTLNRVRTLYMHAATIPNILQFPAGLVAYQLTRIESAIFLAIPPSALLSHTAKTPHARIVASSDFFNYVTRFIEHSILLPQEASVRAQHIHHWIKVASKCQELNNYQTLKAIISALGTPPVERLKRTWAYIPKKSLSRLETMTELMSEANNYGAYREHIGSTGVQLTEHYRRPTVPFLGTFIHDMTYLLAAVHQQKTVSLPTVHQYHADPRIDKLIETLALFQQTPRYDLKPDSSLAKIVHKAQARPGLSQAIHRSKSSFGKLGGAIGLGQAESDHAAHPDDFNSEEQQSLVMQYILMRPWVSQTTVDELSQLREPPLNPRLGSSMHRTSSSGTSFMSNTSSFMRLSQPTSSSSLTLASSFVESRPESLDDRFEIRNTNSFDDLHSNFWHDSTLYSKEAPSIPPRPIINNNHHLKFVSQKTSQEIILPRP